MYSLVISQSDIFSWFQLKLRSSLGRSARPFWIQELDDLVRLF